MSAWYVWTKRDTGGAGWEFEPAASSVPEPAFDRAIASLASNEGFPQLEPLTGSLPSTEGVPIVSAVWEDALGRWVLVLRGRGGGFGVAGATQASVAPAGLPLASAWPAFWYALGPNDIASEATLDSSYGDTFAAPPGAVLDVLRLVARGADYAEVDAVPAEAATLFGAVLPLLPEGIARRCCWSTLHVARRGLRPVVIAGLWPEVLQQAWRTKYQRLAKTGDSSASLHPADEELLSWWVDQPDHTWAADSQATTMAEFLEELRRRRPMDIAEVRALVASRKLTEEQVQQIVQEPELLRALTEDDPALGWQVHRWAPQGLPDAASLTARLLLTDTDLAVDMRRQLRAQVLAPDPHRSRPLTDTLDPAQRLKLAHLILNESLGQDAELARARPWLLGLGITQEAAPDFFGFVAKDVAHLAATDPDAALAQIGEGAQKWDRLHDVIHELGAHAPSTAHLLVASVTEDPRVGARVLQSITPTSERVQLLARKLGQLVTGRSDEVPLRHRLSTTLTRWASPTDALDRQTGAALLELAVGVQRADFMVEPVGPAVRPASPSAHFGWSSGVAEVPPQRQPDDAGETTQLMSGVPDVATEKSLDADREGPRTWRMRLCRRRAADRLAATRDDRSLQSPDTDRDGRKTLRMRLCRRRAPDRLPAARDDRSLQRRGPTKRWVRWARAGLIVAGLVGVIVFIVLTSGAFK